MAELTWEEIKAKPPGEILHDEAKDGFRFIVKRGPTSLCAYVGIPEQHPLAGFEYDDFPAIDCHGGLTFSRPGDGEQWPKGFYWYGWDYSHCDDFATYYDDPPFDQRTHDGKKWLVQDVIEDSWRALYDFERLLKFTELLLARLLREFPKAEGKAN